jgi:hypothetical protein
VAKSWTSFLHGTSLPNLCRQSPSNLPPAAQPRNSASFRVIFSPFPCLWDALSQTVNQPNSDTLKSFHDYALNIFYFYPSRFVPALSPSTTAETPKYIQPTLVASSVTPVDTSSFAVSTIDNTCPDVLNRAVRLGPFTREQILLQLGRYGEPAIIQEPTTYPIDSLPAAISLASVSMPAGSGKPTRTTYAAKACAAGNIPAKRRKTRSLSNWSNVFSASISPHKIVDNSP